MASYEPRGSSIRVVVRLPGGGKVTGTFDTEAEARAWGDEQERKKQLGALGSQASGQTNGDLWDVYELRVASQTDTARWNAYRIAKWRLDPLATKQVAKTTTDDINQWIARRSAEVSPATVNRELNLLSASFTYGVKALKWITTNPCYGCARPERGKPRDPKPIEADEIEAIVTALGFYDDPDLTTDMARVAAAFLIALETGMRSGEILRVRPQDYWKAKRTVHVTASEAGGRKGTRSGRASGKHGRHVPLTGRAMELWDRLLKTMPKDQPYVVGIDDRSRDALFRKGRDRSGVEDFTFHDTKHYACTNMAKFLDVFELSHAVGTKDLKLLRDTYYVNDASASAKRLPAALQELKKPRPKPGQLPPHGITS